MTQDTPASEIGFVDPFAVPVTMVDGVAGVSVIYGNIDMTLAQIRGVPAGGMDLKIEWVVCGRMRLTLQAAIDLRDRLSSQIGMLTVRADETPN